MKHLGSIVFWLAVAFVVAVYCYGVARNLAA